MNAPEPLSRWAGTGSSRVPTIPSKTVLWAGSTGVAIGAVVSVVALRGSSSISE